jgi:hypothetical protein
MNYRLLGLALVAVSGLTLLDCVLPECGAQDATTPAVIRALKVSSASHSEDGGLKEHPLAPVVQVARQHLDYIQRNVTDYTCYLVKRERIEGELLPAEHMYVKFRAPRETESRSVPFSVYMRLVAPYRIKGREVLYVRGQNAGDALVRKGGRRSSYLTLRLNPHGRMAMRDNKYPVTAFGFENLVKRLIDVAELDMSFDECLVRTIRGAKVDDRVCTAYEVTHPVRRSYFRYHIARVFLDDELHMPIRFAAYSWPERKGGQPILEEEYTYRQLQLNVGLSDRDFNPKNPVYGFSERD